jgi:hypothetical protein
VLIPESRRDWSIFADDLPDFADREAVPSVSTVLAWRFPMERTPWLDVAADRGRKVALALELYDQDDLDAESIYGSDLGDYVTTWARATRMRNWLAIERPLWAEVAGVRYIARPDRVMSADGSIVVTEIKSKSAKGRVPAPNSDEARRTALQLAAQAMAVEQRLGLEVERRVAAYVFPTTMRLVDYSHASFEREWVDLLADWKRAQEAAEEERCRSEP